MKSKKALLMARVSTVEQDTERQISDLTRYAESKGLEIAGIIKEKVSGALKNEQRADVQAMLRQARRKVIDCVVISELSRLSRSAFQLQRIIEELTELKVSVMVQTMNIETLNEKGERTPLVDLMVAIIGQLAQMERVQIVERVKSGIKAAQAKGTHCGRPKGSKEDSKNFLKKHQAILKDLKAGLSIRKTALLHGKSVGTVVKVKRMVGVTN